MRSRWVSQRFLPPSAWSNCMSEKTIMLGISSGLSLSRLATSRTSSAACAKLVEPPQGAWRTSRTLSAMRASASNVTHCGLLSKVRTRWRKAGAVSSEVRIPRAMATSIGMPYMLPLTSTRGTSLPRSTANLALGAEASSSSSRSLSWSLMLWAFSSCVRTSSRKLAHCACSTSSSAVERCPRPILAVISCGCSALPLSAVASESARVARKALRAATRSSSSGKRLPVVSCAAATTPLTLSLRKALRLRFMQRLATRFHSISAYLCAAMSVSVVLSSALSSATLFL
mmetsp:Transcript_14158/g.38134  ORF Transcript_14158/g.38134 Transcript_14158/m.38134 type:complete len:286 (-) Transcript_14158:814-1671(-)